jgi:hypothetical protein
VNRNQQIVIALTLMILLMMTLYPPYEAIPEHGGRLDFYRYGFLFDPPYIYKVGVLWSRLVNQWIMVLVPAAVAWWIFGGGKRQ